MIIPAILESTSELIQEKIELIAPHVDIIQVDILDSNFAEGKHIINKNSLLNLDSIKPLEAHLMSTHINPFIEVLIDKFSNICTHIEAEDLNREIIYYFHQKNKKVGISVNPDTDVSKIEPYLDTINYVQFMTVTPGKQGQELTDSTIKKIKKFKQQYPKIRTQADGGVNLDNIKKVLKSGVDDVVIGSAIFGSKDPIASLNKLKSAYEYN